MGADKLPLHCMSSKMNIEPIFNYKHFVTYQAGLQLLFRVLDHVCLDTIFVIEHLVTCRPFFAAATGISLRDFEYGSLGKFSVRNPRYSGYR